MRESVDFHTNATPTFVGTRLRENPGRNPRRAPENTPWARTMFQPLHPYGAVLNLDVINFQNIEKLIDEWVATIKIAATTLELDKENFIKLVELSLAGSVKIGWDNTPADPKASILAGDSKSAIADQLGRLIKIHFIGDGYFEGSRTEKAREYAQALFSLELRSICAVDEYIYWFRKYFFQSGVVVEVAAPMFCAKICSPYANHQLRLCGWRKSVKWRTWNTRNQGGQTKANVCRTNALTTNKKIGILKSWIVLDETLKDMFTDNGFPKCFKMADLGCSSGPNSFFKLNPTAQCFVSGVPGSFYGGLFPSKSLDFVYSSFSLQWLSQVPEGLESNRKNIHMAMASPPEVFEAYLRQYQRDFSIFLSSRGEEMAPGGRMVLTFVGRSVADPSSKDGAAHFTLLADTLLDMINEGLIKEADLHSFNMPIYTPSKQEVEAAILSEGSFTLYKLEDFLVPWDAHVEHSNSNNHRPDKYRSGELVSAFIRAYTEPILATHFGTSVMDALYTRYAKKLAEYLSLETPTYFIHVVSLSKK
ncbi:UNVERIFIED_CONTAM: Benzoate carboxyl methyltransferase [Sesamum calycinum]|uniref:Benzoate carboxyl methyltransferase n=1 Tax=Sesamum calycinum TaxID=2727403 RepID=A0AAW2NU52_9LAMI